jgi:AraC-like DNA-binding protein
MTRRAQSGASGFTVSADLIRGLVDCALACGLPRARFADLTPGDDDRSPSRYAGDYVLELWRRVIEESDNPIVGFRMARFAGLKTFGVLGQIAPRCATILDAFRQAERYSALASQGAHVSVACNAKALTATLTLDVPQGAVRDAVLLWGLTNLSLIPERLTGAVVRPKTIACAFASPGKAASRVLAEYCPFTFDARDNRVVFDRSVADLAIPSADTDLKKLLADVMEGRLAELGPAGSFEQNIVAILRKMLNGTMPTVASLSARVGVSQRTLQRRLRDAQTTFHALLQQVLEDEAGALLARGNLSQGEIAFLLGYSEVSAFSRAYRGWTGHPPGAARA